MPREFYMLFHAYRTRFWGPWCQKFIACLLTEQLYCELVFQCQITFFCVRFYLNFVFALFCIFLDLNSYDRNVSEDLLYLKGYYFCLCINNWLNFENRIFQAKKRGSRISGIRLLPNYYCFASRVEPMVSPVGVGDCFVE